MNKNECIVWCFGIVAAVILLVSLCFAVVIQDSVSNLTESLSQPGITDRIEVESLTFTVKGGQVAELKDLDIEVNSRVIDFFLGVLAVVQ